MATTPKGIYFPDGNTNVNFLSVFQTLASSIDNALGDFTYDSGWVDVENSVMLGSWTSYNSTNYRVCYRKIGKWVSVEGWGNWGSNPAPNGTVFILPIGFRPKGICVYVSYTGGGSTRRLNAQPSGAIEASSTLTGSNHQWLSLSSIGFYTD